MDKKTTRRIIGALVMIALVIIALPLLVNGRAGLSASLQTAEVKAPPFPEPQNETDPIPATMVAKNDTAAATEKNVPVTYDTSDVPVTPFPTTPVITTALEAKAEIDKAQEEIVSREPKVGSPLATASDSVLVIDEQGTATQDSARETLAASVVGNTIPVNTAKPVVKTVAKKVAAVKKPHVSAPVSAKTMADNLNNLKKTAWVVQLGSFKSKDNAIRLTNVLRAKGYKAFIHDTKRNGLTCVYVGPEFKQMLASTLVSRIQQDVKMHGIIVTYKPLEL